MNIAEKIYFQVSKKIMNIAEKDLNSDNKFVRAF